MTLMRILRAGAAFFLLCMTLTGPAMAADIVSVTVQSQSSASQNDVPVTFGHVFQRGEVAPAAVIGARLSDGTPLTLQVEEKATHADGSLRHAILTTELPSLAGNGQREIILSTPGSQPPGNPVALSELLATSFDATVTLDIGGTSYSASARDLLQGTTSQTWQSGPLVSEWLVAGPVATAGGSDHPHLTARFNIRAYAGLERVRVSVIVENNWSYVANPRNFTYDATVSIAGTGTVLSESNVNHYRQSRWRRVFWWGAEPDILVQHDRAYSIATGALPNYDPSLVVPEQALAENAASWSGSITRLMGIGTVESYMPAPGGRPDIGPLPRWAARHLISQDARALQVTLGNGEQSGSWQIHYRDENTDLPISIVTNPNAWEGNFPSCGGSCGSPNEPDSSHQPSLAYYPYLITGDHYFLEELHFWTNWNVLQVDSFTREGALGLLYWDQIRGQGWSLRTLAHSAYITPDDHPLKSYFETQVRNNLDWYDNEWTNNPNANQLHINDSTQVWEVGQWLQYNPFLDDFYTWAVGHLVDLGFPEAAGLRDWKTRFVVLRNNDPDGRYCVIFANTYELIVGTVAGGMYDTIGDTYEPTLNFIGNGSAVGTECGSQQMGNAIGLPAGHWRELDWSPLGYPSNAQPALAMAVNAGVPGAQFAWDQYANRPYQPGSPFVSTEWTYGYEPEFAIVPRVAVVPPNPAPGISLSANPDSVQSGNTTTLTWSTTNAMSCAASNAWSGPRATSGSEMSGPLSSDSTFTLTCDGPGGSTSRSTTVAVVQPPSAPTLTFSPAPDTVQSGETAVLSWSSTNTTSCVASGSWSGSRPVSGNETVGPLNDTSSFALNCTGPGGSISASATVTVTPDGGSGGGGGGGGGSGGGSGGSTSSSGGGATGLLSLLGWLLLLGYARAGKAARSGRPR